MPRSRPLCLLLALVVVIPSVNGCGSYRKTVGRGSAAAIPETRVDVFANRPAKVLDPVEIRTGRYSYVPAKPLTEQINPLLMVIDVRLPGDIRNVGDAVDYLLARSGYRLAETSRLSPHANTLLVQPIADVQRHLGPMTLQDALLALGGPAFRLVVDPVERQVSYQVSPDYLITLENPKR